MLEPPAVRFVRFFDPFEYCMRNVWFSLSTQEQIENAPLATELTVQAKTIEECMVEIRKWEYKMLWITPEVVAKIEEASGQLLGLKPSRYEAVNL